MNEIGKFMDECFKSSRWYHERSDERRRFDKIVMDELSQGRKIAKAVKKAVLQVPGMRAIVAEQTIPELKDYYSDLESIELDIATHNCTVELIQKRRRRMLKTAADLISTAERQACQVKDDDTRRRMS